MKRVVTLQFFVSGLQHVHCLRILEMLAPGCGCHKVLNVTLHPSCAPDLASCGGKAAVCTNVLQYGNVRHPRRASIIWHVNMGDIRPATAPLSTPAFLPSQLHGHPLIYAL